MAVLLLVDGTDTTTTRKNSPFYFIRLDFHMTDNLVGMLRDFTYFLKFIFCAYFFDDSMDSRNLLWIDFSESRSDFFPKNFLNFRSNTMEKQSIRNLYSNSKSCLCSSKWFWSRLFSRKRSDAAFCVFLYSFCIIKKVYIYLPFRTNKVILPHEQGQFFFLAGCHTKVNKPNQSYFTNSYRENNWIHTFPKAYDFIHICSLYWQSV